MALEVLDPGMLSTVQDLGRFGHGAIGVSACGAADPLSLRIGNRLVGNDDGAPAIEMTLRGGTFRTDAPAVVAACGSDFGASVPPWTAVELAAGAVVELGATRSGARCTLCIRGGVAVAPVLGSASTHLPSGLGGVEGRALRKGDRVAIGAAPRGGLRRLRPGATGLLERLLFRDALRATPGPQADWFGADAIAELFRASWQVSEAADRMGLRLEGPELPRARAGELRTEGVCLGAVQVPESGRPIILFVDQQTTGGYPKIANVVTADFSAIGQLRPRKKVRFEPVLPDEARRILLEQEAALAEVLEPA
jgi:antagonist of KipI